MPAEHRKIAVIGLGYVGLPIAVAFADKYPGTVGFDINQQRVNELASGTDKTLEVDNSCLTRSGLIVTSRIDDLREADIFVICVPTPIYEDHRPDLRPLQSASEVVGKVLRPGGIVVYESTVYPGLTERYCGPILAKSSGLQQGKDFKIGYSPERINPGDKEHSFVSIKKVVSAEDVETTSILAEIYGAVVKAGIHIAPSIVVAEAAKVIENTQRDINIALMNELAIICDLLGIRTKDVLDAAKTKWNFLPFSPGLVGGHCIGVDPYYLTSLAQELGYHPDVILAGRRINDGMGATIANRIVRFLGVGSRPLHEMRVGILGITFKEDIPDIRNSRVPDIVKELRRYGISAMVHDPYANAEEVHEEYGLKLSDLERFVECDALVLAVSHTCYSRDPQHLWQMMRDGGVFIDVKSSVEPTQVPQHLKYWSL